MATALVRPAVEHALARGARAVEAYASYPGDYMGSRQLFEQHEFVAVRNAGKRTVMRYSASRHNR